MKTNKTLLLLALAATMLCGCSASEKGKQKNEITGDTVTENQPADSLAIPHYSYPLDEKYMLPYAEFILNDPYVRDWVDWDGIGCLDYTLLMIDDDSIPEMVLEGKCQIAGFLALTQHDGIVDMMQTGRLSFSCILGEGFCCDRAGTMGDFWGRLYHIEEGKFKQIFDYYIQEGWYHDESDTTKYPVRTLNGQVVECTEDDVVNLFKEEYFSKGEALEWHYLTSRWGGYSLGKDEELKATSDCYSITELLDWARQKTQVN